MTSFSTFIILLRLLSVMLGLDRLCLHSLILKWQDIYKYKKKKNLILFSTEKNKWKGFKMAWGWAKNDKTISWRETKSWHKRWVHFTQRQ